MAPPLLLTCSATTLAVLLYFAAGYALWWRLRLGRINWRRWQPWAVLAVVLAIGHFASRGLALLGFDDHAGVYWGGDLGTYLLPPQHSRWLGTAATRAFWASERLPVRNSPGNVAFLGYLLPLVLLATLLLAQRQSNSLGLVPGPTSVELAAFQQRY